MYDYFRGKVATCTPTRAVIECGGIGYTFRIPVSTYEAVRQAARDRDPVTLYAHLKVKEDDLSLFGFATEAERRLFRALITVKGVGPGIAQAVLSGSSVADAVRAIRDGDTRFLDRIKGIGRKTAERVIVDLREKADQLAPPAEVGAPTTSSADDAVRALISLGYHPQIARKAIDKATANLDAAPSVEALVKQGLKHVK